MRAEAKKKWPKAHWIDGKGTIALVSRCNPDGETVTLYRTMPPALAQWRFITLTACGGRCKRWHDIIDMTTGKRLIAEVK